MPKNAVRGLGPQCPARTQGFAARVCRARAKPRPNRWWNFAGCVSRGQGKSRVGECKLGRWGRAATAADRCMAGADRGRRCFRSLRRAGCAQISQGGWGAPGDRQRKTGEGKEMKAKIEFHKSCLRRSPPLRRPSLAFAGVIPWAKRRGSSKRAGGLSLENLGNRGADAIPPAEGQAMVPNAVGAGTVVLSGSKTWARLHMSSVREPGDLRSASPK